MGFAFGGSSIKKDKTIQKIVKQQKEEKKKKNEEKRNKKLGLKKGKTYTKAQLRFKEREAKGLSGLTGGKKGETIAEDHARQKKQVQDAAKKRYEEFLFKLMSCFDSVSQCFRFDRSIFFRFTFCLSIHRNLSLRKPPPTHQQNTRTFIRKRGRSKMRNSRLSLRQPPQTHAHTGTHTCG